jgi:hypothetical protein
MTERDWQTCGHWGRMLTFLSLTGRASPRRLLLFACACCRGLADRLDGPSREALALAERYADDPATPVDLAGCHRGLWARRQAGPPANEATRLAEDAVRSLVWLLVAHTGTSAGSGTPQRSPLPLRAARQAASVSWLAHGVDRCGAPRRWALRRARAALAELLRDLFAPFGAPAVDPSWVAWRGGLARGLAEEVATTAAFDRLPVLADALEDAGCGDAALLGHLRASKPHHRGCWALDALLGRG